MTEGWYVEYKDLSGILTLGPFSLQQARFAAIDICNDWYDRAVPKIYPIYNSKESEIYKEFLEADCVFLRNPVFIKKEINQKRQAISFLEKGIAALEKELEAYE